MTEASLTREELEKQARATLRQMPAAPTAEEATAALERVPNEPEQRGGLNLRLDPFAFRMAGGMLGGLAGTPLGPLGILGGGALGQELAGQGAELVNQFLLGEEITETGGERMMRAGLNVGTDMVMTAAGGRLAGAAGRGLGRLIRGRGAETAARTLRRFDDAGIPVEGAGGAITRNRVVQGVASALRKSPGGAQIIQDGIDKTLEGFRRSFGETAARLSGADAFETGGEAIQTGIKGWMRTSREMIGKQYDAVKGLNDLLVDARPIKQLAQEVLQETEEFLPDAATQRVAKEILERGDDIPFSLARRMRSKLAAVGRQGDALVASEAQSAGKRLAELTDRQMEVAAANGLQDEAFKGFRTANANWKQRAETIDLLESIAKNPKAEDAFRSAISGANKGPTVLRAIKDTIDPALWDDFVAVKLRDMALETAGQGEAAVRQFSPTRFLRNWRNLTDSAKDVLFPKGHVLRKELDNLVEVAGTLKDATFLENTSGTGGNVFFLWTLTSAGIGGAVGFSNQGSMQEAAQGAVRGAAIGAGIFGSTLGAAKLMTNPDFVRWLADGSRIRPDNFNGISAHIGRLIGIAKQNPDLADAITDYVGFARVVLDAIPRPDAPL